MSETGIGPPPHRDKRKRRGFSLVEVLFAIGVVAIGLLALMSVFITGQRANTYGKNLSDATNHARQIMEIIRSRGLAFKTGQVPPNAASGFNDGTTRKALNATPPLQMAMMPDEPRFTRTITTVRASNQASSYLYSMLICTVTVYWEERGVIKSISISSLLKGST